MVASGPAGGVIGAARLGAARGEPRPHRVRHGRHDRQGRHHRGRPAEHDVANTSSATASRRRAASSRPAATCSRSRPSTSPRSAPAAARSPASTRAACCRSGRNRPAPFRVRPATASATTGRPSPTPTWCSASSIRSALAGGRLADRPALSERAIETHVAQPLGLTLRGRGARHPRGRQCRHGARHPRRDGRARPRSARPHADRHRRQRRHPRGRRGARSSASAAWWCRRSPACSPRSACWRPTSSTSRSTPSCAPLDALTSAELDADEAAGSPAT